NGIAIQTVRHPLCVLATSALGIITEQRCPFKSMTRLCVSATFILYPLPVRSEIFSQTPIITVKKIIDTQSYKLGFSTEKHKISGHLMPCKSGFEIMHMRIAAEYSLRISVVSKCFVETAFGMRQSGIQKCKSLLR